MKTSFLNLFNKAAGAKNAHDHSQLRKGGTGDLVFKAMPSWWMVLFAYVLALIFCDLTHQFFVWFPPYLQEVFKNLRGLPQSWADLGLYWGERGLKWTAVASAVYHQLWQLGTRYKLSSHDIQVENWFPVRRVTTVPYGSVRKAGFQQNILGLIFNYGHIEIDTGSPAGPLLLLICPRPQKFLALLKPKVEAVLQPGLSHHRRAGDV